MAKKSKKSVVPPKVGLWATIWWAVSCLYVLLLVWMSKDAYVAISTGQYSFGFFFNWTTAMSDTYDSYEFLRQLLLIIAAVWIIGGLIWLRELKRLKISYKAAFKDLFLTLR